MGEQCHQETIESLHEGRSIERELLTLREKQWVASLEHAAIGCTEDETKAASTAPSLPLLPMKANEYDREYVELGIYICTRHAGLTKTLARSVAVLAEENRQMRANVGAAHLDETGACWNAVIVRMLARITYNLIRTFSAVRPLVVFIDPFQKSSRKDAFW